MRGPLADCIDTYLAHKRSLGKQLITVGYSLRLLDDYLHTQKVVEIQQITSVHLSSFVAARPRHSARSYNELIREIRGLLNWMVVHELLPESPLRCETRRISSLRPPFLFNAAQAARLFELSEQMPSTAGAPNRGEIYHMIFLLLYGLGLRVGEVSRLCREDVDLK